MRPRPATIEGARRGSARPHKGWIKTVMALLVQPDLMNVPYRVLADEADVT
ncbi:MAG: hypothetical protein U0163_16115 [Gemmatimonadaceae bacterium]